MIRLSRPEIDSSVLTEFEKILSSGMLVSSKYVSKFEEKLTNYLDPTGYVACVSSGTSALHLSFTGFGIKKGDRVAIPAFTFPSVANICELTGAEIEFVDIDPESGCPVVPENLREKNISAFVYVYQFGNFDSGVFKFSEIKEAGAKVIEDAACALGLVINGKRAGTLGNAGCFSFHPRKIITTGEGGAVFSHDKKIVDAVKSLRNHGQKRKGFYSEFVLTGFNYRMGELNAAIGISQLDSVEDFIKKRVEVGKKYVELLKEIDEVHIPQAYVKGNSVFQTFVVILNERINRDTIILSLRKKGVEAQIAGYAVHVQPYFSKKFGFKKGDFPVSEKYFYHGLALPIHPLMSENDVRCVVKHLKESINEQ